MTDWKLIETAPKDGEVLVWDGSGFHVASVWWIGDDGVPVWFNGDAAVSATHWQPLPDPPVNPNPT